MIKLTEDFKAMITSYITYIMGYINTLKSLPTQKDSKNTQDPTTVVPDNRRDPPLDSGQSTIIIGMWNLKYEIISPKLYELLIKIEIKGDTTLYLKNFYNHIKMCLNAVTRLRKDLLTGCQSINSHSEFAEYFILDCDQPSYSWNVQI